MDCCIRTAEIAPEIPRVKKITRITAHAVFFRMDFILFALEVRSLKERWLDRMAGKWGVDQSILAIKRQCGLRIYTAGAVTVGGGL